MEGNKLAVNKDNKHATILSDSEFIQCTLSQGLFCSLNIALHHIDSNNHVPDCHIPLGQQQN